MREGDDTHPFGIVASGRVALRLLVPERGATTILTVEPGDVLGWSALVPPCRATSTAVAVEPTRLLEFDVETLRRACARTRPWRQLSTPVCWRRWLAGWERPVTSCSTCTRRKRSVSRGDGLSGRPGFLPRPSWIDC